MQIIKVESYASEHVDPLVNVHFCTMEDGGLPKHKLGTEVLLREKQTCNNQ